MPDSAHFWAKKDDARLGGLPGQTHAIWYMDWAQGFGVPKEDIINVVPTPAMEAVVNHLWKTSSFASVAVCLAATNIGIEWATGAWTFNVKKGVQSYLKRGMVQQDKKIMTWVNAHSDFDDTHPYEAMNLVANSAEDENDLQDAIKASQRSLEYYAMALDDCLKLSWLGTVIDWTSLGKDYPGDLWRVFPSFSHRVSNVFNVYPWSSPIEGSEKRKFYAVLHYPRVDSPEKAVRASIIKDFRAQK